MVATDCDIISDTVKGFGFSKVEVYIRDEENAKDVSSTESVMLEYLNKTELPKAARFILAQCTSPFTTSGDFSRALFEFESSRPDSLLSVVRVKRFFWDENGQSKNYDFQNRPRRQDFVGELMENGAFYISTIENIMKSGNRLSGSIGYYVMPSFTGLEIDEPDDWIIGEQLMKKHLPNQSRSIKLVLSDLDGVLTDGGVYYGSKGEELVKFNRQDGKGFEILRNNGVKCGVVTSEDCSLNQKRMDKLKLDFYFKGAKSKKEIIAGILESENLTWENLAYIGDDINDLEVLSMAGLAACPSNAVTDIKGVSGIIQLEKKGGEGAFREFVDHIV